MKDSRKRAAPPRLQRLAGEARKLAMECVNGTAPELGAGHKFISGKPACVAGHLQQRAGLPRNLMLCQIAFMETMVLIEANDKSTRAERQGAVVFPLLALADAIEDASKTPKENP